MTVFSAARQTPLPTRERLALLLLVSLHVVTCCVSLIYVTRYYGGYDLFTFDAARLSPAILTTAPLALFAFLFMLPRFSFGYLIGFYLYTMILGYLWLAWFSNRDYPHWLAITSAFCAMLAFLVPALFVTAPLKQRFTLSRTALEHGLLLILVGAAIVIGVGALYNFRIVGIADVYAYRGKISLPAPERYAMGIFVNALLPFAFACFLFLNYRWRAAAALGLLFLFYPVTLLKSTLFGPIWLLFLAALSRFFEARIAVILSLLAPVMLGVAIAPLARYGIIPHESFISYFGAINFRMIAVPSIALDIYNDFFSKNDLTHFCQIGALKPFMHCPYSDSLAEIMSKNYMLGSANASLFATEGIASVGPMLAPLVAFGCGLVIALANRLSSGLPSRFVLLSAGMLSQVLLNIPFATALLSYGAAPLFVLWYITPREIFESQQSGRHP